MASLDHALWFHRPFRADDWLLYSIDSPSAQGSRGLARGLIYDRDGQLVASTAQEGLIRVPARASSSPVPANHLACDEKALHHLPARQRPTRRHRHTVLLGTCVSVRVHLVSAHS